MPTFAFLNWVNSTPVPRVLAGACTRIRPARAVLLDRADGPVPNQQIDQEVIRLHKPLPRPNGSVYVFNRLNTCGRSKGIKLLSSL